MTIEECVTQVGKTLQDSGLSDTQKCRVAAALLFSTMVLLAVPFESTFYGMVLVNRPERMTLGQVGAAVVCLSKALEAIAAGKEVRDLCGSANLVALIPAGDKWYQQDDPLIAYLERIRAAD